MPDLIARHPATVPFVVAYVGLWGTLHGHWVATALMVVR